MQITEFKALAPDKYTMRVTHPTGIEFVAVRILHTQPRRRSPAGGSWVVISFGEIPGYTTELCYGFSVDHVTNKYVVSPYPELWSYAPDSSVSDIARQANTSLFILYALLRKLEERGMVKAPVKKGKSKKGKTKKVQTKKKVASKKKEKSK